MLYPQLGEEQRFMIYEMNHQQFANSELNHCDLCFPQ